MKLLLTLMLTTFLAACAGPGAPSFLSYLEKSEVAMSGGRWQEAYRFLEDSLVSSNASLKTKALELYKSHPEMRVAAAQTFENQELQKTLKAHGFSSGLAVERNRLRMYAVVATNEELEVAADNLQVLVDAETAERARIAAEVAAQRAKGAAEIAAQIAKDAAEAAALDAELQKARANAIFRCKNRLECEKAFSLTQIFIATNTDMKIQMANDTVIETHNPTGRAGLGASAFKIPKEGTSAEIQLVVSCRTEKDMAAETLCKKRSVVLYQLYPLFLKGRLVD